MELFRLLAKLVHYGLIICKKHEFKSQKIETESYSGSFEHFVFEITKKKTKRRFWDPKVEFECFVRDTNTDDREIYRGKWGDEPVCGSLWNLWITASTAYDRRRKPIKELERNFINEIKSKLSLDLVRKEISEKEK